MMGTGFLAAGLWRPTFSRIMPSPSERGSGDNRVRSSSHGEVSDALIKGVVMEAAKEKLVPHLPRSVWIGWSGLQVERVLYKGFRGSWE